MESEALQRIDDFRRQTLQELLDRCEPEQRDLFRRMYGTTNAQEMHPSKIDWAIQQCENTLRKNRQKHAQEKEVQTD